MSAIKERTVLSNAHNENKETVCFKKSNLPIARIIVIAT